MKKLAFLLVLVIILACSAPAFAVTIPSYTSYLPNYQNGDVSDHLDLLHGYAAQVMAVVEKHCPITPEVKSTMTKVCQLVHDHAASITEHCQSIYGMYSKVIASFPD
ncbi:MAG: hypothetical protein VB070_04710 [Clostridiaceae bacterium]|nr:hypothetical protein [Clostridiaceae bacterium]